MIDVEVIDLWPDRNFAKIKDKKEKCNLMVGLLKLTSNKKILSRIVACLIWWIESHVMLTKTLDLIFTIMYLTRVEVSFAQQLFKKGLMHSNFVSRNFENNILQIFRQFITLTIWFLLLKHCLLNFFINNKLNCDDFLLL